MLKVDTHWINDIERRYPGFRDTVQRCEAAALPPCPHCGSPHTALVMVGIVGRSIHVAAATTKVKLLANGPRPGQFYCLCCDTYFDAKP